MPVLSQQFLLASQSVVSDGFIVLARMGKKNNSKFG